MMIEVNNLYKSFNGFNAVKGISFRVKKGENLILLGTSGSGKTTTLKMINRIIKKDDGTILINGKNTDELDHIELRRRIGYVIQNIGLFPHYTVEQNIGIVPQILKWHKNKISERVDELLSLIGLDSELKKRKPSELSGGQQQRVGIARALAANPEVILLDEPFGALDPITRKEIQNEFKSLESVLHKTMIMVTHDVKEACILGDRICLLDNGEIQQIGTPKELIFRPVNNFVRDFIGSNAYELELLVITLKDLVPFLERNDECANHSDFKAQHTLQEILENKKSTEKIVFEFKGNQYVCNSESLLGIYFSHRQQITSNLS